MTWETNLSLIGVRVPCNDALADHPTVQVADYGTSSPAVGILGILILAGER